jgi:YVTN family beta-propeller protein
MKIFPPLRLCCALICAVFFAVCLPALAQPQGAYQVFVSNEKSGDLTVFNGSDLKVTSTIPVGKRPRGIHASPDGKTVYVALSADGTRLYISNEDAGAASILNIATEKVEHIVLVSREPEGVAGGGPLSVIFGVRRLALLLTRIFLG